MQTQYAYDPLGDVTSVLKCSAGGCGSGQQRTFVYDGMGRLIQATNPESGTYSYAYGTNSTLQSRTDPRGYVTSYTYDSDNRLTAITYKDGTTNASYTYDAASHLTQSSNANVTNNYLTFDGDGRVLSSNMQVGSVTYPFSYSYDLAGNLTQEVYPSGRTVNATYDIANREQTVNGVASGTTTKYVQSTGYFPHGAPQFWQYGSNLYVWQSFSKLLQPQQMWATQNNNGSNWMFYAGNGFNQNESMIAQNEGFGAGVPYNSMTFLTGQFAYDNISRLASVTDTNYTRNYSYDEFGNLSITSYSSSLPPSSLAPVSHGMNLYNSATNHLVSVSGGVGYEARGMMTQLGAVTMAYDAEGNMKNTADTGTGQSITWIFDAEGQRAQKLIQGGSWTLYIHDALGQLAAEYNNQGETPACVTCYLMYDMLGSIRMVTDQNQNVVARHDYVPYGEEIQNGMAGRVGSFGSYSNVTQGFTGQESDGGTAQLDFDNARHFAAVLGAFVQPDPYNAGADVLHPQSWNGYAYVGGSPLDTTDPSGMDDGAPLPTTCPECTVNVPGGTPDPIGTSSGGECFQILFCDAFFSVIGTGVADRNPITISTPSRIPLKSPAKNVAFAPNNVNCNTKLPNGQTVGSVVRQQRAVLQGAFNAAAAQAQTGPRSNPLG